MPKRLLLADDSLTIHRVVELTFADEDFEVISVSNGNQAIEKINATKPDIIIADVNMPEKDGYEVCAFVKNTPQFSAVPVLLLKGTFEPFNQERADSVRADGIIQKPFQSQTLIDKVNSILGLAPTHRMPGKTAERVQSEKVTQPQPPFLPKTQQPPQQTSPIKDFIPFSHPSGQPSQVPRPQPVPPQGILETQAGIPVSQQLPGVSPFMAPGNQPSRENIRPHPPAPKIPNIPPFPINQTAGGGQDFLKPLQPVPVPPIQPKPTPPAAPVMDDSPFGFTTAHQSQRPGPTIKSEDQLSKDAFEAGKDIYQTFAEPPSAPDAHISSAQQKDIAGASDLGWGRSEYTMETPAAIPPKAPVRPMPEKSESSLPDFSDALSDVSMAFNSMMQKPESRQEIPTPIEQHKPSHPDTVPDGAEPGQWDMGIQPEMGKAGEIMFDPESLEKEQQADQFISPYEMEDTGGKQLKVTEAKQETFENKPDFDQFNIPFIGEGQQMHVEKPDIPAFQSSAGAKPLSSEPARNDVNLSPQAFAKTEIDDLAEKVASRIVEKISTEAIKEIAWELVPGIIEKILREKLDKS
jgi:CheY-like chemotaxis protein